MLTCSKWILNRRPSGPEKTLISSASFSREDTLAFLRGCSSVLLVANGDSLTRSHLNELVDSVDGVIAVDGGLRHLLPGQAHWLIGDLDSAGSAVGAHPRLRVHHTPDQNQFDLEKVLHLVLEAGVTRVVVAGALGGRLDHTLANLLLLSRFPESDIRFHGDHEEVWMAAPCAPGASLPLKNILLAPPGTAVSLLPLSPALVTSRGLRWELTRLTLHPQGRLGSSNQMAANRAELTEVQGAVLISLGPCRPSETGP